MSVKAQDSNSKKHKYFYTGLQGMDLFKTPLPLEYHGLMQRKTGPWLGGLKCQRGPAATGTESMKFYGPVQADWQPHVLLVCLDIYIYIIKNMYVYIYIYIYIYNYIYVLAYWYYSFMYVYIYTYILYIIFERTHTQTHTHIHVEPRLQQQ